MSRIALGSKTGRIILTISIGLVVFLLVYLGWAFYTSSNRYAEAVLRAESVAHTNIGKEGYEYIFEPGTHTLVDRIKPNGTAISLYVLLIDYISFQSGTECSYPDPVVCEWMALHIFYGHDPAPMARRMGLCAAFLGLLCAMGFDRWYYYLAERKP